MAFVGGFGSYLLGLNKRTYEQAGVDTDGNAPGSYKEPGLEWMIGFLFVVSFVGLLALVPLRKVYLLIEFVLLLLKHGCGDCWKFMCRFLDSNLYVFCG